ncbi:MAG: radical SAM protein [Pseudonocardiaceae bacterium]
MDAPKLLTRRWDAARHQFTRPKNDQSLPVDATSFLELEITGLCQLKCRHCYADSSPESDHGTMTADDWERVINEEHAFFVDIVQFIGGEPTLHPGLSRLVRYALGKGLKVDVYTNLVHVTPELWELFSLSGVSLGTSWYSADSDRHAASSTFRNCAGGAGAVVLPSLCMVTCLRVSSGRFLVAGNVKDEPVGDILGGTRWREIVGSIPAQGVCTPADSNDCDPAREARWTGGRTLSG